MVAIRVVEAGLSTLKDRLNSIPAATVRREPDKPVDLTAAGAVILFDGDAVVEEESMSPRVYHWRQTVEIEVRVIGSTLSDRRQRCDALLALINEKILLDRDLNGTVDFFEIEPLPSIEEDAAEGRATERRALVNVSLYYATHDALGFTRA